MNQEESLYGQKINEIAQRLHQISKDVESIINDKEMSLQTLRKNNLGYMMAVNNYKKCRSELSKINPPVSVQQEHADFMAAIQMFIAGTELMYRGVCLCSFTINEELIKEGGALEQQGKIHAEWLAEAIAKKLATS
ncbi:hypothetical protein [Desulfosporosinus sp.]|uniref:hypothetical protein n=1 Tax=Desulfosporosinus sp. TaxID=157907 RepID=UPI0025B804E8|nr:hypothetical protein [Desulfosporosinus sp.]MBC2723009.1 hypothetical protein [Desulfosporosinus sp.]MBC2727211.1 hypothetical protein [Desulfosporosinus sp.]